MTSIDCPSATRYALRDVDLFIARRDRQIRSQSDSTQLKAGKWQTDTKVIIRVDKAERSRTNIFVQEIQQGWQTSAVVLHLVVASSFNVRHLQRTINLNRIIKLTALHFAADSIMPFRVSYSDATKRLMSSFSYLLVKQVCSFFYCSLNALVILLF